MNKGEQWLPFVSTSVPVHATQATAGTCCWPKSCSPVPTGPPGPFPQSCSLGRLEPVLLKESFNPGEGLCIYHCWISWCSCLPIPSSPLGWQLCLRMYQVVAQFYAIANLMTKHSVAFSHPLAKILSRSLGSFQGRPLWCSPCSKSPAKYELLPITL